MEKLQLNIVIEILGRPKEHVSESIETLVIKLGAEKGVSILDKTMHEPIPVKDSEDLFTTFVELTLELDSLLDYFGVLFAYMPSNTELIHPEKITLNNADLNELANKLLARLHEYESITKHSLIERDIMAKKLHELAPDFFKQNPKESKSQEKKGN